VYPICDVETVITELLNALYEKEEVRRFGKSAFDPKAIARGKELQSKIENLYKLMLQEHKPIQNSTVDQLRTTAVEIIEDAPEKFEPITSKCLADDGLFHTEPSKSKPNFCGKLLKQLLEAEGYKVSNYKNFYSTIWKKHPSA
jgi:hypothetical protein